jgi:hypothetical protein
MKYHFEIIRKYFLDKGKSIFNPKQPHAFDEIGKIFEEHVSTLRLQSAFAEFVNTETKMIIRRLSELPAKEYYNLNLHLSDEDKFNTYLIERID